MRCSTRSTVSSIARALELAAALEPGSAAVEAAAPYSLEREMGRVAEVLAEVDPAAEAVRAAAG